MLSNRQVKTPSSSSLLLPRCLEASPWPGWGTLLPLTPQGAPCPEPALRRSRVCLRARRASSCAVPASSWSLSSGVFASPPAAKALGTGGVLLLSPLFHWPGLGRARDCCCGMDGSSCAPVLRPHSPCPGAGGSASGCCRLTRANIALAKCPSQREEVPACLRRDLALLSPRQLVSQTHYGLMFTAQHSSWGTGHKECPLPSQSSGDSCSGLPTAVSAAQGSRAAAHQHGHDPAGLLSHPAPLPNSTAGSPSSDAPSSPPCEN